MEPFRKFQDIYLKHNRFPVGHPKNKKEIGGGKCNNEHILPKMQEEAFLKGIPIR
jgi:hypothetical protein